MEDELTQSEYQRIIICVEVLKDFLHKCSEEDRKTHLSVLREEKEGWVEYQLTEWGAKAIQEKYNFDVWDLGFYFAIDVWVLLNEEF